MTRVAPGFDAVAEEFARTLDDGSGQGAAFAAYLDGRCVVDLWGGLADRERGVPWREDTVQLVFSGTKGLVAACMLVLVDRGALELDAPVARYWPEFAAAGKSGALVRHVLAHTAGVPGLRRHFTFSDLLDGRRRAADLARQQPWWKPGTRLAYHAVTFGWLCDELIRRVDGRSTGRFFAEEVAKPLRLELWIGLPPAAEARVARLHAADGWGPTALGDAPKSLLEAVYGEVLSDAFPWNEAAFHRAEIPAVNAIGTARSLARFYACLACGGELDGVRVLSERALGLGRRELSRGLCAATNRPYAFGAGFELQTELGTLGPPAAAFGHTGSGGSSHGAWPEERVGFSFVSNELRPEAGDERARRLLRVLHEAVSQARRARSSVAQKSSPESM